MLRPIHDRLLAHVLAAERLHGDDTTVPVLAKGKTVTGRCWTYVRDDRPFGGRAPPAAVFFYSRDRSGEHPQQHLAAWGGILQADAYSGYGKLYDVERTAGADPRGGLLGPRAAQVLRPRRYRGQCPTQGAAPRAAVISPIALEAVQRIDALFEIERAINGLPAEQRLAVRQATKCAAGRRARSLDARGTAQAVAPQRRRRRHRLHAEALGRLHPLPRRRTDLPHATTPPNGLCAAWRSAERPGCSPAPIAAASVPPAQAA